MIQRFKVVCFVAVNVVTVGAAMIFLIPWAIFTMREEMGLPPEFKESILLLELFKEWRKAR